MTMKKPWLVLFAITLFTGLGCPSNPPPPEAKKCVNGIDFTQLNPNARPCTKDCDCNNQQYAGKCVDGKCVSSNREPCFEKGLKRPCSQTSNDNNACSWSVQICQDEGLNALYWGDCKKPPTSNKENTREFCTDGIDNDCNRKIDYLADPACKDFCRPGTSRACYGNTGNDSFPSFGTCRRGQQLCKEDNTWGPCLGAVEPTKEICDKQDNDCDGKVDEDLGGCKPPPDCTKGQTRPCYTAPRGCTQVGTDIQCKGRCKAGVRTCGDNGNWGECKGQESAAAFEDCNGIDDNCDGTVDEGCVCPKQGATQACFLGTKGERNKGQCKDGIQICQRGFWSACRGSALPRQEACNGLDDDCNGKVDEGCSCSPGQTQTCFLGPQNARGKGECKDGTQTCVRGVWGNCEGSGLPAAELCDGKDNDCDGKTDEPEDLRAPRCQKQDGVCFGAVQRCAGGAGWQPCNDADYRKHDASFVADDKEGKTHCDGVDNDCDGKTDEECQGSACKSNSVRVCYTGPAGTETNAPCRSGIEACNQGKWSGQCLGEIKPKKEVCGNKADDDCNGMIDDSCPSPEQTKETPADTMTDAGPTDNPLEVVPEARPEPQPDTCIEGTKRPCNTGKKGVCASGEETCTNGAWSACTETTAALKHELCDGKDNNCNGLIDEIYAPAPLEGLKPAPPKCLKQASFCKGATLACRQDTYEPTWSNVAAQAATQEVCTALDYTRQSADYSDKDETLCDGLDNDCDGKTDENCPFVFQSNGGDGGSMKSRIIRKDAAGNVYWIVDISNSDLLQPIKLGPYSSQLHKKADKSFTDQLLIKFDKTGAFKWVQAYLIPDNFKGLQTFDAVLDAQGNHIFVVGEYSGQVKVGNQTLRATDFTGGGGNTSGDTELFLLKFRTNDGGLVWAANMGSNGADAAKAIALDSSGGIYIAVEHQQPLFFYTTHKRIEVSQNMTAPALQKRVGGVPPRQLCILKFTESSTSGTLKPKLSWIKSASSNSDLYASRMAFDNNGTLWLLGNIQSNDKSSYPAYNGATFGTFKATPRPTLGSTPDPVTPFLASIDVKAAQPKWTTLTTVATKQSSTGIDLHLIGNDIYVLGFFHGTETLPTKSGNLTLQSWGGADPYVLKLDSIKVTTGNPNTATATWSWAAHWGTQYDDYPYEISSDAKGRIVATGWLKNNNMIPSTTTYFGNRQTGSSTNVIQRQSFDGISGFVVQIATNGTVEWGIPFGGLEPTVGTSVIPGNPMLVAGFVRSNTGQPKTLNLGSRKLTLPLNDVAFLWNINPCTNTPPKVQDCFPP